MTQNRQGLLAAVALAGLIVAGCDRKPEERAKASGEVLEGTVSDSMIATEAVRSEPPLAPRKSGSPGARDDKDEAQDEDEAAPGESRTSEASPAEEASPAPTADMSEPPE